MMLQLKAKVATSTSSSSQQLSSANSHRERQNWIDAHAPKAVADLQLHHTKRKALVNWLSKASECDIRRGSKLPVLVLYGGSGIGKSSSVELTCTELGVGVVEWNQDLQEADSMSFASLSAYRSKGSDVADSLSSQLFLRQSTATPSHSQDQFRSASTALVKDLFNIPFHDSGRRDQTERFLATVKYPALPLASKYGILIGSEQAIMPKQLLLVHDPVLAEDQAFQRTNELLLTSGLPVVIIASGQYAREDHYSVVNSVVSKTLKACADLETIYWTPHTPVKIVKQLRAILKKEHVSAAMVSDKQLQDITERCAGDLRHAILELELLVKHRRFRKQQSPLSQYGVSEVIDLIDDDDEAMNRKKSKAAGRKRGRFDDDGEEDNADHSDAPSSSGSRDTSYSQLHTIAKILHAKLNCDGQADFDIDQLLDLSECSCDYLLSMLLLNSVDFIEDHLSIPVAADSSRLAPDLEERSLQIMEALAENAERLSEAELLLSRKYDASVHLDRSTAGVFPEPYVQSICGRSALVAKGAGLAELCAQAKEKFAHKAPFRALRSAGLYALRMQKDQLQNKLQTVRKDTITRWMEVASIDQEEVERDDFSAHARHQYHNVPTTTAERHMLPSYTVGEWALTVLPYCRMLSFVYQQAGCSEIPLLAALAGNLIGVVNNSSLPKPMEDALDIDSW